MLYQPRRTQYTPCVKSAEVAPGPLAHPKAGIRNRVLSHTPGNFFLNRPMIAASIDKVEVHALHAPGRVRDDQRMLSANQIVQLDRSIDDCDDDGGGRVCLVRGYIVYFFRKGSSGMHRRSDIPTSNIEHPTEGSRRVSYDQTVALGNRESIESCHSRSWIFFITKKGW